MARGKVKADCIAATRGEGFAGIPKCVIASPAYRSLSLHARAVLVELVARMNGYNNGAIAVSQRELVEALGCTSRKIVSAVTELLEHGMLDVLAEGQWKARLARQYRLTFISTKTAHATEEYRQWTPRPKQSGASHAEAVKRRSASHAEARELGLASHAEAAIKLHRRKTANSQNAPASHPAPLIDKPYPPVQAGEHKGDDGCMLPPLGGLASSDCERCSEPIDRRGRGRRATRFCSETCRKSAESARAYQRRKHEDEAEPIGALLNGTVHRLMAGARA